MNAGRTIELSGFRTRASSAAGAARAAFAANGDGTAAIRARADEADALLVEMWGSLAGPVFAPASGPALPGVALFALGGYGRRELFPYSDIDLLLLCANEHTEREANERIRALTQALWDIGWRVSPATRTVRECERLDPVNGLEFAVSLLDRRFLAGDTGLAARFERETLPAALGREGGGLEARLAEAARARHARYGGTIFHLEPNLKEYPGGLRDAHLIHWFGLLRGLAADRALAPPSADYGDTRAAFEFLAAARCFLHFRNNRDENTLDWGAQDEAAAASVGLETLGSADPAYWMRTYYRHARAIHRRANLLLDAAPAAGRKPLLAGLRRKRTTIPGTRFTVEENRIHAEEAELVDAEALLRVFAYAAQNGSRFTEETEARITEAIPALAVQMPEGPFLWNCLRDVLLGVHAAHALRLMHALGLLELILPEFHGIDALVVRDAYHRYTVDEHTFLVIENVHMLRTPRHEWEKRFSTLLPEVERMDLLLLALLLHDTGKARRTGEHARESIELAEGVFARLEFDLEERETVRKLIRNHLEMSYALRRDIFDGETIRSFAGHAPSQQQLKMLTLLTFADIKAVNPDALTPWKAENIWQLYIAAANYLDRSVDESRFHVDADPVVLARILSRVASRGVEAENDQAELRAFLEGMPQRYLQTRLPDQIGEHFKLSRALADEPVQLVFRPQRQSNEVTLLTRDRPMLFADMAGALSAWGMNIVKADAFSNAAGVILDTFQFTDPFRTLELNPGEHERFVASLRGALTGQIAVDSLLSARQRAPRGAPAAPRTAIEPRFEFDGASSTHSTLLQVVARDTPGLLRTLAAGLAACRANIEVALVDTEGEVAIDVFYLTGASGKLSAAEQGCIRDHLWERLRAAGEAGARPKETRP